MKTLRRALLYTLQAPSSLFRAQAAMAVAQCLGRRPSEIFPWATAIEMIHSASLIHDDLPCMDNSKKRRGKKTNHLVFGEDMALLAGSCLFVESFFPLTDPVFKGKSQDMLCLLVSRAGFSGLMGGQALDICGTSATLPFFLKTAELKTGSLISAAVEGPALLWGSDTERRRLKKYALFLGQAYQTADDLLDGDSPVRSREKKQALLKQLTNRSMESLKPFKGRAKTLAELSRFNEQRVFKLLDRP